MQARRAFSGSGGPSGGSDRGIAGGVASESPPSVEATRLQGGRESFPRPSGVHPPWNRSHTDGGGSPAPTREDRSRSGVRYPIGAGIPPVRRPADTDAPRPGATESPLGGGVAHPARRRGWSVRTQPDAVSAGRGTPRRRRPGEGHSTNCLRISRSRWAFINCAVDRRSPQLAHSNDTSGAGRSVGDASQTCSQAGHRS